MAENQGPLLLLWVTVALAVLSPERVHAEWKRNGSLSLCPREYLVPTSPPLPPFTLRCSYTILKENNWTLESMDVGDAECCPQCSQGDIRDECLVFGKSGVAPVGSNALQFSQHFPASKRPRVNLREDSGAMFLEGMWSPPLLEEVVRPWFCAIRGYGGYTRPERNNRYFTTALDVVVPAESGNVSMSISPDQSLFGKSDFVQVQCVGVVGIKQATQHGHLVLQRYSHTASDWIAVDTTVQEEEFPDAVLGTRVQETVEVALLVSDILEVAGVCQLTFRCFLNYPNYKNYLDRAQTKIVRVSQGSENETPRSTTPTPRSTTSTPRSTTPRSTTPRSTTANITTPTIVPPFSGTTQKKADNTGVGILNDKIEASTFTESDADNRLLIVLATAGGVLLLAALVLVTVFVVEKRNTRRDLENARGRSPSLSFRHSLQSPRASQQEFLEFQQFHPVVLVPRQVQEPLSESMADSETDPGGSDYSETSSNYTYR